MANSRRRNDADSLSGCHVGVKAADGTGSPHQMTELQRRNLIKPVVPGTDRFVSHYTSQKV